MSKRRQFVLRAYPSKRNPFHQKVCARVAALKSEGLSMSDAIMKLLLRQVLDDSEKAMAGLAPNIQATAEHGPLTASTNGDIQTGAISPLGNATATIPESSVDRLLSGSGIGATISDKNRTDAVTQRDEQSYSTRSKWSSLSRTSKLARND